MFATKKTSDKMLIERQAKWIAAHNLWVTTDTALANRNQTVRILRQRADNSMSLYTGCQKNHDEYVSKENKKKLRRVVEGFLAGAAAAFVYNEIKK